jgi:hypothetical protein
VTFYTVAVVIQTHLFNVVDFITDQPAYLGRVTQLSTIKGELIDLSVLTFERFSLFQIAHPQPSGCW